VVYPLGADAVALDPPVTCVGVQIANFGGKLRNGCIFQPILDGLLPEALLSLRQHQSLHTLQCQGVHVLGWTASELWNNVRFEVAEYACSEAEIRSRRLQAFGSCSVGGEGDLRVHGGKVEEDVCELEAEVVFGVSVGGMVAKGRVPGEICADLLHR